MLALAMHGLALVSEGRVHDGMTLLDEAVASATAREITDPQWYYFACWCMIDACDRVRDFARSLAWCDQLHAFAERWRVQAFRTTCRIKYTAALLWRGDWQACERQLEQAIAEMTAARPSAVAGAVVRLAELRRRQGRRADAEQLLARAHGHPLAAHVRAALALDSGDCLAALDLIETMLRRVTASARTERVALLEMKARAHIGLGQRREAQQSADELHQLADIIGTEPVQATALAVGGMVAADSHDEPARRLLQDAVFLFENSGSRYEAARARLELARCLMRLGRAASAVAEAAAAREVFAEHGADADAQRARALLDELDSDRAEDHNAADSPLTRRQREVLSLISQGLSDQEIAQRLFLSEHTVHRHVANVLMRLGVSSRAAAVAAALRMNLL